MRRQLYLGMLGGLALLMGCSSGSDGDRTQSSTAESASTAMTAQGFSEPLVAQSAQAANRRMASVPGLLQPTNAKARIPAIQTGRPDPFAVVPGAAPIVIPAKRSASPTGSGLAKPPGSDGVSQRTASQAPAPGTLPTITTVPMAPLPSLPGVSANGLTPLPPINIPVAAPGAAISSPTSLAESIQVSGVVQVAGRWSVIVREPNASSSRYVSVGDYLENGRVLVKKIVAADGSNPSVVLQQNGVEIRKSLG